MDDDAAYYTGSMSHSRNYVAFEHPNHQTMTSQTLCQVYY